MAAASLRALLERSIDYAGLFPPCDLELEPALRNHAEYVRSADSWMLGSFILPVAQFEAASSSLSQFDHKHPLRISALGPKTSDADEFRAALGTTVAAIGAFSARSRDVLSIGQLEMPLPQGVDPALAAEALTTLGELKLAVFVEAPADAAESTIALLSEHRAKTHGRNFGFKLRTGGTTAETFPSIEQLAIALVAAARLHVPIKFTAGLHHPVRMFRSEVETKMHGFLNVLGAGVLAAEHHWDEMQTAAVIEDEDPDSFSFDDAEFAWREWEIATDRIRVQRKLVTSLGSCSFDEPREDLRALNLL
jgi:hypothetical protein